MNFLYDGAQLELAEGEDKCIRFNPRVFNDVVKFLHKQGRFTDEMLLSPKVMRHIRETYRILDGAISASITQETPEELTNALRNNAFIFSGFKTYHTLSELGLQLTDETGTAKPFHKFAEDVKAINAKYNIRYLQAEYDHAVHSSQMAVKWKDFEKDGDDFNLQYRTAGDERVRAEHAQLDGVTLPPSDKFWKQYLPPNGWRCRCQVVQVLKEDYRVSDSDEAVKWGDMCTDDPKLKIFRFNPGMTLNLFPEKHPYNKVPKPVKKIVETMAAEQSAIPVFTAKTIAEAEEQFRALGVKCNLDGFKKKDIGQVKEIFDCVAKHFSEFPDLKEKIKFVGSVKGRVKMLEDALYEKYKMTYPGLTDEERRSWAKKYAKKWAGCDSSTYAYSARGQSEYGLNGLAFNSNYTTEKFNEAASKDTKYKYHPIGCDTVKSIFDHEFGHKIDELLGLRTDPDFLAIFNPAKAQGEQYITDNLSHYAYDSRLLRKTNYTATAEFIAEAWSEYLNNPEPRELATAVGKLIERKYAERK